jgi:cytochrome P450
VTKGRGIRAEAGMLYPIYSLLNSSLVREHEETEKRISDFSERVVLNAESADLNKSNIFTDILKANSKTGETISRTDASYEAASLMLAGGGTTAVTLTYLVWAVLSDQGIQQRLEADMHGLPEHFTDAHLEDQVFLNAVIEETLRLYGAAPGSLPRTVPVGGLLINDIFIPAGYTVSTQAYTLHRDPHYHELPHR